MSAGRERSDESAIRGREVFLRGRSNEQQAVGGYIKIRTFKSNREKSVAVSERSEKTGR